MVRRINEAHGIGAVAYRCTFVSADFRPAGFADSPLAGGLPRVP